MVFNILEVPAASVLWEKQMKATGSTKYWYLYTRLYDIMYDWTVI